MMHYRKGENVEQEIKKADLPFDDCMPKGQNDFLWMQVKGGTHVKNVISYAKNALEKGEYRTLVWSGSGGGLVKTVSCAEIIKRSFPLYQVTRMDYTSVEEHWKPTMEGLEEIVARRQIPSLHILMSLEPIEINGVQKPGTTTHMLHHNSESTAAQTRENNGQRGQQYRGSGGSQKKNKRPQKKQQQVQPRQADRQTPSQNQSQNAQSKPHVPDNTQTGAKKKTTTPENRQQKYRERQRKPKEAGKTEKLEPMET